MFFLIFFSILNLAYAQNFCIKESDKLKVFQNKIDHWQSALSDKKASIYPQVILTQNLILSFAEDSKKNLIKNNKVIKIKNHYCVEKITYTSTLKNTELAQGFKKGTTIGLGQEEASIEYLPLFKVLYFNFLKKEFSIKINLKGKSCNIQDIKGPLLDSGLQMNIIYPENNKECATYEKSPEVEDKIDFESNTNWEHWEYVDPPPENVLSTEETEDKN